MEVYAFLVFLAGLGLLLIIPIIFVIMTYILLSLTLMQMASNSGVENAWLAWVPVGNLFIIGKLIRELNFFGFEIPNLEMALPVIFVVNVLLSWIPIIGFIIYIVSLVVIIMAIYKLIEMYKPNSGILTIILLVIIAPVGAFMFYSIRNNSPVI